MSNESRNFARERKEAITKATKKQRDDGARAYAKHCRACQGLGVAPAPFDVFFCELLESSRGGASSADDGCLYEGRGASYERQFEGKRGFDR